MKPAAPVTRMLSCPAMEASPGAGKWHPCANCNPARHRLNVVARARSKQDQDPDTRNGEVMRVILAQPRGFCAGVIRAIEIVERSLERHGAPVYVRHEIVHNKAVVDGLRNKG